MVIGVAVSYTLAKGKLKLSFKVEKEWIKKLSSFGIFTFGTSLSSMTLRNIDQFILGTFQSKVYLALYNTAVRITNLIEIPTNAMSSIVYPKSVSMVHENKTHELKNMYERSVAIIFMFVLPIVIAVMIFPDFFIIVVAGRDYLDAVAYLRITIFFALFVPFMRQSGTVLDSMGKPKINFYLTIIAAGVNVCSNLLFIHFLGPIGAAYATLVSYALILTVNQVYIRRYLGIEIGNIFVYIGYYYKTSFAMILKKLRLG
jgi:O-antigen/teichoic acid export membrane protein